MKTNVTKNVSGSSFTLRRNDVSKKAGVNRLSITVSSNDWRVPGQTVSMTLREAIALRDFLNTNID